MDLEKLIQLVREREFMYNYNHKNYHDTQRKEAIWRAIGKRLNSTGELLKKYINEKRCSGHHTL